MATERTLGIEITSHVVASSSGTRYNNVSLLPVFISLFKKFKKFDGSGSGANHRPIDVKDTLRNDKLFPASNLPICFLFSKKLIIRCIYSKLCNMCGPERTYLEVGGGA